MSRNQQLNPIIKQWVADIGQRQLALAVLKLKSEDGLNKAGDVIQVVNIHILDTVEAMGSTRKMATVARSLVVLLGSEKAARELLEELDLSDKLKAEIKREL